MLRKDYLTGLDAVRRAVEMNPGSGFVNAMAGCALVFGDEVDTGLTLLDRAMMLGPKDPSFFSHMLVASFGHLSAGRTEQALDLALRSIALNPNWDSSYIALITAYVMLDRIESAKEAAEKLLAIHPGARASGYHRSLPIRSETFRDRVITCLRQAGIPD